MYVLTAEHAEGAEMRDKEPEVRIQKPEDANLKLLAPDFYLLSCECASDDNQSRHLRKLNRARIGIELNDETKARLNQTISADLPTDILGHRVADVNRTDGIKFIFEEGSLLLLRVSGTEPVARCYAETTSEEDLEVLLEHGRKFALG